MKTIGTELADALLELAEDELEDGDEQLVEGYTIVEQGEWGTEPSTRYHYSSKQIIFKHQEKLYELSRGYVYSDDGEQEWDRENQKEWKCPEVEKVEVVTNEWKPVAEKAEA